MKQVFVFSILLLFSSVAFAAGETPHFFAEIAALFVASAVIAYLGFRVGLTPIIGFLLAGVIIGPNALGLVQDREMIDAAAEVGVILLLFTIGIEFSLEKLARISRLIFVGGGLQVALTLGSVTALLMLFGVSWQAAVFTGCLVSLSSTAIIMKLLADRHETNTEPGQASLGILIFQDLAVVAMVLLIPLLGGEGGTTLDLLWAIMKAIGIIAIVLLVARRGMPRLLELVARTCSPEIFLLTVVAVCFGTAYLTSLAGVSLSLGAFLAGLLVSESRFGQQAFSEILPLQILFSAVFFISVGILLDVQFLLMNLPIVLLGILAVIALKSFITFASVRVLGYGTGVATASALILAQVGEFSFVLERTGREAGLSPLGLNDVGSQMFIACTVLLMGITPFMATLGKRLELRLSTPVPGEREEEDVSEEVEARFAALENHVVIAGYGETARVLAGALDEAQVPYGIATLSPTGASEAEKQGRLIVRGDYTKGHILSLVGVERARLLVIPDDQPEMAHRTVSVVRANHPELPIVVYAPYNAAAAELREAGASTVISADHAATKFVVWNILSQFDVPKGDVQSILATLLTRAKKDDNDMELSQQQRSTTKCNHTNQTTVIQAPTEHVCPECVALGDSWVHLRICMSCGHVGCCDSSKNKHATRHFHDTKHPIIKSFEPGENWAYCYEDKTTF